VWPDLIERTTICGSILKELAVAAETEGHGKWTETKKYLVSVKLTGNYTGRSTKCNLRRNERNSSS
jgi:hypothetical protein